MTIKLSFVICIPLSRQCLPDFNQHWLTEIVLNYRLINYFHNNESIKLMNRMFVCLWIVFTNQNLFFFYKYRNVIIYFGFIYTIVWVNRLCSWYTVWYKWFLSLINHMCCLFIQFHLLKRLYFYLTSKKVIIFFKFRF